MTRPIQHNGVARISLRLSAETHDKLKIKAAIFNTSINQFLLDLVEAEVEGFDLEELRRNFGRKE